VIIVWPHHVDVDLAGMESDVLVAFDVLHV